MKHFNCNLQLINGFKVNKKSSLKHNSAMSKLFLTSLFLNPNGDLSNWLHLHFDTKHCFALNDYSLNTVQNTHHRGGRIAVRLVCSEVVEFKLVKLETGRRHSDTSPNCECSLLTGSWAVSLKQRLDLESQKFFLGSHRESMIFKNPQKNWTLWVYAKLRHFRNRQKYFYF